MSVSEAALRPPLSKLEATPPISPLDEIDVNKMSPNQVATTSTNDDKKIQNNNTSSYNAGGRLKFFKGKLKSSF